MIKRAIISSTIDHDYSFFAPIAALCWRDLIGFEPSLFLVGTEDEWRKHQYAKVVMQSIDLHSICYVFINRMEGVLDKTIAQCSRQYAACYPFAHDTYLFPSDADLLPVKKSFYEQHDPSTHAISLFYYNAYIGEEETHWPSCHTGAVAPVWREVMGLEVGKINECMKRNFDEYGLPAKMVAWNAEVERAHAVNEPADAKYFWPIWFTDELVVSKKIRESKYYPSSILRIPRDGHPPKDRLDRSSWPYYCDTSRITDIHSLRPGWSAPNWPRLRPVLHQLLPNHKAWLDKYRQDFRDAIGVDA